jgi:hypothetical protein
MKLSAVVLLIAVACVCVCAQPAGQSRGGIAQLSGIAGASELEVRTAHSLHVRLMLCLHRPNRSSRTDSSCPSHSCTDSCCSGYSGRTCRLP